jgi:16S rRNA (uracil1498-N3)-methyltransferase
LFLHADVGRTAVGDALVLDGEEGRHAADVRRVRVGEVVLVGDGAGVVTRVEVTATAKGRVEGRVLERREETPPVLRVTVAQALVKGDRGELAVELATEAGADAVIPWRAERSVARWDDGPRGAKALAKWRSTAREAAKQARRAVVPEVADPVDLHTLADRVRDADLVLLAEGAADDSLATVALPIAGELLLVVGPEGGVTEAEHDALVGAGAVAVRMGPAVLRTSSAAAVALGALGARTTRWA